MFIENEEIYDYGFNFSIHVRYDEVNGLVFLTDNYGFFPPIPVRAWNEVINKIYLPLLSKEPLYKNAPLSVVYGAAVRRYARVYHFCYIGLN